MSSGGARGEVASRDQVLVDGYLKRREAGTLVYRVSSVLLTTLAVACNEQLGQQWLLCSEKRMRPDLMKLCVCVCEVEREGGREVQGLL